VGQHRRRIRSPYRKGVKFEYKVRDKLAELGFLVIRCARSKGTKWGFPSYDLVAVSPAGKVYLIECKAYNNARPEKRAREHAEKYKCEYVLITPSTLYPFLDKIKKELGVE